MSTYSTTLRLELIGAGQQDGTWGDTTNSNLGDLIEAAITNTVDITFANAQYTMSANNGLPDEARNAVLNLIGTNSAQQNLVAPAVQKTYIVKNDTGANVAITAGGANVIIQDGATQIVYCDGTDFLPATIPYGAGSTGTGNLVYSASPTLTGTPLAPTAGAGTNTTQIATTAFVTAALSVLLPSGVITMWSGSVASIPSGWYLCDGSNSTPDLRDRFIVGAGSTYAVAATGGSANATLVSHTHTATSVVTDPGHSHLINPQNTTYIINPNQGGGSYFGGGTSAVNVPTIQNNTTGVTVATTNTTEGASATNANLPPYYALAYIMKA